MTRKINMGIFDDEYFYFFSMLTDRFKPLNNLWAKELERRFNKKFKPIYILPFQHNKLFKDENFIVLNERLFKLHKKLKNKRVIDLIYPEEINKQFSKSPYVKEIISKLIKKQGKVFVLSFSSVWLELNEPNVIILGPDPKIAEVFDNKIEHINLFNKLKLPVNQSKIFNKISSVKKYAAYPFFISAAYSSGGFESRSIYTPEELANFYTNLRPINKRSSFIVSRLLTNISLAPNTCALITDAGTEIICLSDQILRENKYLGNIYPSKVDKKNRQVIINTTKVVGKYLSKKGFRGLFGCDFLVTENGDCFVTDINPRRQGGYFCNCLMTNKINLINLEARLIFGESLPKITNQFNVNYCWAHCKLVPYYPNSKIINEFKSGSPAEPFIKIGKTYKAIYYPKNYTLITGNPGFYLITSESYERMVNRLIKGVEIIISTSFDTYQGLSE